MQLSEQMPPGGTMTTKQNPDWFGYYFPPVLFLLMALQALYTHSAPLSRIYTEGFLFIWVFLRQKRRKIKCWFRGCFSWDRTRRNSDKGISDLSSDLSHTQTTACCSSTFSWKVWQCSRKSCLLYTSQQHAVHINNFRNSQLGMLTPKAHWCQHSIEEGSTLQEISPWGTPGSGLCLLCLQTLV